MIGKKYGRLLIKEFSHVKNRSKYWKCLCECGKSVVVRFSLLKNGNTKSCGCYHKDIARLHKISENKSRALPLGVAAQRSLFRIYKRNASKRNVVFLLPFEVFINLTSNRCHYCGCDPNQIHHKEDFNGSYQYNGIDREDNTKGYTIENSVSCCKSCNLSKGKRTKNEFLLWVKLVYKKHFE